MDRPLTGTWQAASRLELTLVEYFEQWRILICELSGKICCFFLFCICQLAFVVCLKLFSRIPTWEQVDLLILTLVLICSWSSFQKNTILNSDWLNHFETPPEQYDSYPGFAILEVSVHQLDFVLHSSVTVVPSSYNAWILLCQLSLTDYPKIDYFLKDCEKCR